MTYRPWASILIACLSFFFMAEATLAQPRTRKFKNAREAVQAARSAKDDKTELEALDDLEVVTEIGRDDIVALHGSLKELETRAKGKGEEFTRVRLKKIARALEKSKKEDDATIATLLVKEADDLPNNLVAFFEDKFAGKEATTVRISRVAMMMELAGKNKNKAALPSLRRIAQKGGMPADLANRAIAQIGDPEDLERFVMEVKRNPQARVNFSGFGFSAIDRIMREVDDPNLNDRVRGSLIAGMGQAVGLESIPKYKALLHHKDRRVVETASRALANSLPNGDLSAVKEMLNDSQRDVRFQALVVLEEKTWSDDAVLLVVDRLKNDKDGGVRAEAAHILGKRRVRAAEADLKAALNDPSSWVRSSVEGALQELSGEAQRRIDQQIEDAKRNRGR